MEEKELTQENQDQSVEITDNQKDTKPEELEITEVQKTEEIITEEVKSEVSEESNENVEVATE